jgi:DNA (cytosine-5)-methyltransferase 1
MIVLDGCCGAGGAAHGYVQAGHQVYGVDIAPQPNYLNSGAAGFRQADILEALRQPRVRDVGFISVSPPCEFYSAMSKCRPEVAERYPELITPVRELLNETGRPWVIENVEAARPWLKDPLVLCAQMFRPGVLLYRHRLFEVGGGFTLADPPAPAESLQGRRNRECGWPHPVPASRAGHWKPGTAMSVAGHVGNVALARRVMEIGWTTRGELAEAVPPFYTEWIGRLESSARHRAGRVTAAVGSSGKKEND